MLGNWKADILVLEKSEGCEALRPKCIIVDGLQGEHFQGKISSDGAK